MLHKAWQTVAAPDVEEKNLLGQIGVGDTLSVYGAKLKLWHRLVNEHRRQLFGVQKETSPEQ